ncbi:MAG: hypothetical protein GX819_03330, partial [Clostridiaceae bacterium]|nr:hypothetical protein [Clostridiaceae bacterium]
FTINPYLLLFPLLFVLLLVLRLSVIPVLFLGVLTGSILTVCYQQQPIQVLWLAAKSGSPSIMESMSRQSQAYWNLLDKGGLQDQWWTVALILCVLVFGGVMKASGMLEALPNGFARAVRGKRTLGVMAVLCSFFTNLASPDHHLSISLPGRILRKSLAEEGAEPENLSRPLADAGPSTAALVPWSMTSIVMTALLGVELWAYAPWAVILWASPLLAILFALLGIFSSRGDKPAKKSGNGHGPS